MAGVSGGGDEALSRNLRRLMYERGLSVTALARMTRIAIPTLSKVVNHRNGTTLKTLRAIREALGCSWDALLGEREPL